MPHLSSAQYGKDNIRVYKVHRDEKSGTQSVAEMTVCVLLRGQIDRALVQTVASILPTPLTNIRYTEANNSVIVTTDTIKNTVYILAKQNSVTPPELFGAIVATHFVEKYSHIYSAEVKIKVHRWTRIIVDGEPHPHSFIRDGSETRNVELITNADGGIRIRSSIAGLLILKSTGSEFNGFIQDDYTTLPEVNDRVFSTEVDCVWLWDDFSRIEEVKSAASKFDDAWNSARAITLNTFATDKSASVQSTMYKMCEQILALLPAVQSVDYSLPNKHYFEIGEDVIN